MAHDGILATATPSLRRLVRGVLVVVAFGMALGSVIPALAQRASLPSPIASAGVTQTQWDAIREDVRAEARRAGVAEAALLAAVEASGIRLAQVQRRNPPMLQQAIFDRLRDQANELSELQRRIDALLQRADPTTGAMISQARTALNEGRLSDADRLLQDAAEDDLVAIQRADAEVERRRVRAAETIAIRGRVATLQADFTAAADLFQRAALTAPQSDSERRSLLLLARASVIGQAGQMQGDVSAIRQALQFLYGDASTFGRSDQAFMAGVQSYICAFENSLTRWDGATALTRAAAACTAALASLPTDPSTTRASALLNYANVLSAQHNWQDAIRAYDRAREMNASLGNDADARAAAISSATSLAEAAAASRNVVQIRNAVAQLQQLISSFANTRDAEWAGAYNNLGLAQTYLGDVTGDVRAFLEAQNSYLQAVNFFSREQTPAGWAQANKNFGLVSERIATMALETGRPEIAIQALQNVIRANENVMLARTRQSDPAGWEEANAARSSAQSRLNELQTGRR
ncbi:MAG: hypothetical protein IT547_09845 [Hyphomonadaceae bacterium]|nr:hypothetical protein [Hyphomonadaceae bacterium]